MNLSKSEKGAGRMGMLAIVLALEAVHAVSLDKLEIALLAIVVAVLTLTWGLYAILGWDQ